MEHLGQGQMCDFIVMLKNLWQFHFYPGISMYMPNCIARMFKRYFHKLKEINDIWYHFVSYIHNIVTLHIVVSGAFLLIKTDNFFKYVLWSFTNGELVPNVWHWICESQAVIDHIHKSHNAHGPYPWGHHLYTFLFQKWCIVEYVTGALWDLCLFKPVQLTVYIPRNMQMLWLYIYVFRVASLALGQSYDCPSASEVTLKDLDKIDWHLTTTKHL